MVKKAALLNDISGLGRCSLTADISVITTMGIQACPLPTGVYTAQTGYSGYKCRELTDLIPAFKTMWKDAGFMPDGILTGFIQNDRQADEVIEFVKAFNASGNILLVDPVMADHGRYYANYSPELLQRMKILAGEADIITPNISELCLLAGADMEKVLSLPGSDLVKELEDIAMEFLSGSGTRGGTGCAKKTAAVTGIPLTDEESGEDSLCNLIVTEDKTELVKSPHIMKAYSGTGDLFAAVVLGSVLNGKSVSEGAALAGGFITKAVRSAVENGVDSNEGTDYEPYLGMLADI